LYFLNIKIFLRFFDTIIIFYLLKKDSVSHTGRCEPHRQVRAARAGVARQAIVARQAVVARRAFFGVKWINDDIRRGVYKTYRKLI